MIGYGYNVLFSKTRLYPYGGIGFSYLSPDRDDDDFTWEATPFAVGLKSDFLVLKREEKDEILLFSDIGLFYEKFNTELEGINCLISLGIGYYAKIK